MGLISDFFGGLSKSKDKKILPWIALNDITQLDAISSKSNNKPQIIFKHSTRCSISSMVMNQFVDAYNFSTNDFDLYYLDLLSYRDLSDSVSHKFQVIHQSPQLLVIKNEVVKAHGAHGDVNEINLNQFINNK